MHPVSYTKRAISAEIQFSVYVDAWRYTSIKDVEAGSRSTLKKEAGSESELGRI